MSQTLANAVAQRTYEAIKFANAGAQITLRHISPGSGPAPLANPPTVEAATIATDAAAGATVIDIAAEAASGQLIAGDSVSIGGIAYPIAAAAAAALPPDPSGFTGVVLGRALTVGATAGAPVSFVFAADETIYATRNPISLALANGEAIRVGDTAVSFSAWRLAQAPADGDLLIIDGQDLTIISVLPVTAFGKVVRYNVQARTA